MIALNHRREISVLTRFPEIFCFTNRFNHRVRPVPVGNWFISLGKYLLNYILMMEEFHQAGCDDGL